MLDSVTEAIRECYERAEGCRRRAMEIADPAGKESFLLMERRWLDLARSYELTDRLSRFNQLLRSDKISGRST